MGTASRPSWSVEFSTPLGPADAIARLRAVTAPWASALSKHVGSGGRHIHGDWPGASRFEGDIEDGRFRLQRIHYQGASHGPRLWSEGEIVEAPTGAVVRIAYRPRRELYISCLIWALVLFGLTGLGVYLGFGDRLPMFLLGVAAIFALGLAFVVGGVWMERRICTALFREVLGG